MKKACANFNPSVRHHGELFLLFGPGVVGDGSTAREYRGYEGHRSVVVLLEAVLFGTPSCCN